MTVDTKKAANGQSYVEIAPANPQVVYVPQYNPVTIYNTPAPAAPLVVQPGAAPAPQVQSGVSTGSAVAIGLLSFGVGMAVGSAINRNNNYYPYPAWGYGGVYYGGRPYYPPPYRPVYPGYRPAYGYNPPPNYQWNQYNKNVNVNVNNNYYNQFNRNTASTQNIYANSNARNAPGLGAPIQPGIQPSWKGQSTYQGARLNDTNRTPGASMANVNPANRPNTPAAPPALNRPSNANNFATANRPNVGGNPATAIRPNVTATAPANRASLASNSSGNLGNGTPTGRTPVATPYSAPSPGSFNKAAAPANLNRSGDRGYLNAASNRDTGANSGARPAFQPQNRAASANGAFAPDGNARSERAASNRGRASLAGRKN
jgi:hypothetical protein